MTRHQTHRWTDVLDSITQSYNNSFHRSIKMTPRAVTKNDEPRLWKLQYGPRVKLDRKPSTRFTFKKGDTGRISHLRQPFHREYDERWTMEYFVVDYYPVPVCCANELPTTIKKRPQTFVTNTDTCDQPDTHLITFHFPQEASLEFFDSSGNTPVIYHRRFLTVSLANGPNFLYTPDRLQPAETNTFGLYAIYFVVRRYRNVSMTYVLAMLSTQHLEVNDCIESERKDIEQRIVMENENGRERWNLMGNRLPNSEIVYFCQTIVSMYVRLRTDGKRQDAICI